MADAGSIDYYLRMIVTHGMTTSSEDFLVEFGLLEYERGKTDALVDAAADAVSAVEAEAATKATPKAKKA